MSEIILYSTHCPQCKILTKKLQDANITYTEVTDVEVMLSKGISSVPILEVDGTLMNLSKANEWIKQKGTA